MKKLNLASNNYEPSLSRTRASYNTMSAVSNNSDKYNVIDAQSVVRETAKQDVNYVPSFQPQQRFLSSVYQDNSVSSMHNKARPISIRQPIHHIEQKHYSKQKVQQLELGKQLKSMLELLMSYDNKKSIERLQFKNGIEKYFNIQQPLIPCFIQKLHQNIIQEIEKKQQPYTSSGVLPSLGFSYYIVDDIVFFQDLIRPAQMKSTNPPIKILFQNQKVLYITEGKLKSSVIEDDKNLLFVLHPGKIGLYKYYLKSRDIIVESLNIFLRVSYCASQIIVSKNKRLFYVNGKGQIVEVDEKKGFKWIPFSKTRYYLHKNTLRPYYSSFVKTIKESSLPKAISEFLKASKKSIKQIYNSFRSKDQLQVISFVVNNNDNTIVNLVDKGWDVQLQCYSIKNQQIQTLLVINQYELSKLLELKELFDSRKSIIGIQPVNLLNNNFSNYVLTIKDGTRVFVNISKNKIISNNVVISPNIQRYNSNFISHLYQPIHIPPIDCTPDRKVIKSQVLERAMLMTFEKNEENGQQTYLFDKNFMYDLQVISKIDLTLHLDQQKSLTGLIPAQYFLFYKNKIIFELQNKKIFKNNDHSKLPFKHLNEIALQVYYPPAVIYFINGLGIQMKYKMRPIDVIFTFLFNDMTTQQYCQNIFSIIVKAQFLHASEVESILFQILLDKSGEYYIQSKMMSRIQTVNKTIRNSQFKSNFNVQSFTTKVGYKQISNHLKKKIMNIINTMASKQNYPKSLFQIMLNKNKIITTSIDNYYFQHKNPKQQGLILYLTRLLKPIWNLDIKQIALHVQNFYVITEKVETVYQQIIANPIGISLNTKQSSHISQAIINMIKRVYEIIEICKIFEQLPNIQFCEALYMTPQYFQQYIFQSLFRGHSLQRINQDCFKIPLFVTSSIGKIISLYKELSPIEDINELIRKVQSYPAIPSFVHQYLVKYKDFPKHIYVQHSDSTKTYAQSKQQLTKYPILDKKLLSLRKQLKVLNEKGAITINQKQDLNFFTNSVKILCIQKAILNEYYNKQINLSTDIAQRLESQVFSFSAIRSIVDDIGSLFIDTVYMLNMNDKIQTQQVEDLIESVKKEQIEDHQEVDLNLLKRNLLILIEKLLQNVDGYIKKPELTQIITCSLLKIHCNDKQFSAYIKNILNFEKTLKVKQIEVCWVPFKLLQWGYTLKSIQSTFMCILDSITRKVNKKTFPLIQIFSSFISYVFILQQNSHLQQKSKKTLTMMMNWFLDKEALNQKQYQNLVQYVDFKLNGVMTRLLNDESRKMKY